MSARIIVSPPKSNQRLWKSESRYGCHNVNRVALNGGIGPVELPRVKHDRGRRGGDPLERDCEFEAGEIDRLALQGLSQAQWDCPYRNALDVVVVVGVGSGQSR